MNANNDKKQTVGNTPPASDKILAGYHHIKDDGDCNDHGFFLPKQNAAPLMKSVCNSGIKPIDVSDDILLAALVKLSDDQKKRVALLQQAKAA